MAPRPFIGEQDYRLGEVETSKLGVDRDGDDGAGMRDVLGLEPRPLGSEQDRTAARHRVDFGRHFRWIDDRQEEFPAAHRRGKDRGAIGNGVGHRREYFGVGQNRIRSACRRAGLGIGPAIARGDEAKLGQPEIEHCPRGFADILTELRADEDDDRAKAVHNSLPSNPGPSGGTGVPSTASAISAKSPASVKSL